MSAPSPRSAAAFDVRSVSSRPTAIRRPIGDDRGSAAGALEIVRLGPRWVNLARALEEIAEAGFWRVGPTLTARAEMPRTLAEAMGETRARAGAAAPRAKSMRQNTAAHCDELARLPISPTRSKA